jgi:threonyl-tRNA synthetase
MGMIRVRKFQLTDAHIFARHDQLKDEFVNVCRLIAEGMKGLGLDGMVTYRFSKRDPENKEKYYPDDDLWNRAESVMKEALDEIGFNYVEAKDEAAFYGPKLDIQARNVNGKEDTLFTAQIDFLLPEKFNITYIDADGSEKRPAMIHRSTIGSLERVFAFLIEHYGGAFPLWLSPVQVKVLSIGEGHRVFAEETVGALKEAGIRVELDGSDETLGKKIRNAKTEKVPYMLVVGDKEVRDKVVTLESRDKGNLGQIEVSKLIEQLKGEIEERT